MACTTVPAELLVLPMSTTLSTVLEPGLVKRCRGWSWSLLLTSAISVGVLVPWVRERRVNWPRLGADFAVRATKTVHLAAIRCAKGELSRLRCDLVVVIVVVAVIRGGIVGDIGRVACRDSDVGDRMQAMLSDGAFGLARAFFHPAKLVMLPVAEDKYHILDVLGHAVEVLAAVFPLTHKHVAILSESPSVTMELAILLKELHLYAEW